MGKLCFGVDLGGTTVKMGVFTVEGSLLSDWEIPTRKEEDGKYILDDIAESKTFGNNDIIACTNFLSVGVDICDKYNFEVFFDDLMMPQDVEQLTNRIRNNNS